MKSTMNFAKGLGLGMIAGVAAVATYKCMCKHNRKFAKKSNRAARAVSDIMEDIQDLLN